MVPPVEVGGEVVGGEDGRLMGGRRGLAAQAEVGAAELGGGEVWELGDPVDGGGVQALVPRRPPEVRLEHLEPVGALLLVGVGLPEPAHEAGEVRLRVKRQPVLLQVHHLQDQRIFIGSSTPAEGGGDHHRAQEEEEEEREEERAAA